MSSPVLALCALLFVAGACDEAPAPPVAPGLEARAGDPGGDARSAGPPSAAPSVRAVRQDLLAGLYEKEVAGWRLQRVTSDEHALGRAAITSALAVYARTQDGREQEVAVAVIDGAREPQAYLGFDRVWTTKLKNASLGYMRLEVGDDRGVQIVSRHPLTAQLHFLVARRFVVQVDSEGVEPEDLRTFLFALPLDRLRSFK